MKMATAIDNWWLAASSGQCACSCITSRAEFFGEISNHPGDSDLVPCDFWHFPKLKSPLKGERFQTIDEIQENMMGQLMVTGRTMWGPKMPTLKGTEASLSYVQCFLYLESSSINVSIFHIVQLNTFWIDCLFIYIKILNKIWLLLCFIKVVSHLDFPMLLLFLFLSFVFSHLDFMIHLISFFFCGYILF